MQGDKVETVYSMLRWTFGLIPIFAGLDKFLNLLTDWQIYLNPLMSQGLPVDPTVFMYIVGIVEVSVGAMILTYWTRIGAYIAALWLVLISINLVTLGILDVAVRDIAMAVAAFSLGQLEEARQENLANGTATTRSATLSLGLKSQ